MNYAIEDEVEPSDIVGTIAMLRSRFVSKSMLLVEGGGDYKFFYNFIDHDRCEMIPAFGRDKATTALGLVRAQGIRGVLAIVDRDYDDFLGVIQSDPDVVVTEEHDIEVMMLKSPALEKILLELGSSEKIRSVIQRAGSVRKLITDRAHYIGILRYHSLSMKFDLKFDETKYTFIDRHLNFDVGEMVRAIANQSRKPSFDCSSALAFIERWRCTKHDEWMMCCGHDLTTVLGKSLVTVLGSQPAHEVTQEKIEQFLRLAYSREFFETSDIPSKIRSWEIRNLPFIVLAA